MRKSQWLDACQVTPESVEQVIPRLYSFMTPFGKIFPGQAAEQHATTSVCGRLADVEHKNIAAMAYRLGQSRLPLPGCLGWETWNAAPLRQALGEQGTTHLGQADGVRVFAPAGWPTSGRGSVGGPDSGVAVWAKSTTVTEPLT